MTSIESQICDMLLEFLRAQKRRSQEHYRELLGHGDATPSPTLMRSILKAIRRSGRRGMTGDELEVALGELHQCIGLPLIALRERGFVTHSGRRRPTRTGSPAIVWVATKKAGSP